MRWAHPRLLSLLFLKISNQMSNSSSQLHIFTAGWSYLIGAIAGKYWDYRAWKSSQRLQRCLQYRRRYTFSLHLVRPSQANFTYMVVNEELDSLLWVMKVTKPQEKLGEEWGGLLNKNANQNHWQRLILHSVRKREKWWLR